MVACLLSGKAFRYPRAVSLVRDLCTFLLSTRIIKASVEVEGKARLPSSFMCFATIQNVIKSLDVMFVSKMMASNIGW